MAPKNQQQHRHQIIGAFDKNVCSSSGLGKRSCRNKNTSGWFAIFRIMSEEDFNEALSYVKNLPSDGEGKSIDNNTKLQFYGLFKQITAGPCNTKSPGRLQLVERAKWNAWNGLGKMSKADCMKMYVDALTKADPDWRKNKTQIRSKL